MYSKDNIMTPTKTYEVTVPIVVHVNYKVEADSPEEAKKLAQADYMKEDYLHDMEFILPHYYETEYNDEDEIVVGPWYDAISTHIKHLPT